MANFPFFRFPYNSYYYNYPPTYYRRNYVDQNTNTNNVTDGLDDINRKTQTSVVDNNSNNDTDKTTNKRSSKYNHFGPINFTSPFSLINYEEPIIEMLGIQLYLDDIIILGLLFFLYKEGVQDEMLFLSLILLLLT